MKEVWILCSLNGSEINGQRYFDSYDAMIQIKNEWNASGTISSFFRVPAEVLIFSKKYYKCLDEIVEIDRDSYEEMEYELNQLRELVSDDSEEEDDE